MVVAKNSENLPDCTCHAKIVDENKDNVTIGTASRIDQTIAINSRTGHLINTHAVTDYVPE